MPGRERRRDGNKEKMSWGSKDGEMIRQRRGGDRETEEGERRDREERESIEEKQQDPDRAMERVLDPAALPGLGTVGVGGPATCSGGTVERWSARALGERVD